MIRVKITKLEGLLIYSKFLYFLDDAGFIKRTAIKRQTLKAVRTPEENESLFNLELLAETALNN